MANLVIVDTDVLIDAGRGVAEAIACLQQMEQRAGLTVSAVTQMELIVGCRNKAELRALQRFLSRFRVVRINQRVSDTAVDLLRHYRLRHGLLIADALIAATALVSRLPLMSKNLRHYEFIKGLHRLDYPQPFASWPA